MSDSNHLNWLNPGTLQGLFLSLVKLVRFGLVENKKAQVRLNISLPWYFLVLIFLASSVLGAGVNKENNIEFRIAYKSASSVKSGVKTVPISVGGQRLFVKQSVALTGEHIASAKKGKVLRYEKDKNGLMVPVYHHNVTLKMTKAGTKKLRVITKNNIRHYLVLFVNAQPIINPQILAEIIDGAVVLGGLSETKAKEVAGYFR